APDPDEEDLDERHARRLGRCQDPHPQPDPALRVGCVRGDPRVRDRPRPGGLPAHRPHRPALPLGEDLPDGARLHRGGDRRGDQGRRADRRGRLLLHPPAGLPRLRRDGAEPAAQPHRGRDRLLAVGSLPRAGGDGERLPRDDLQLAAHQPELDRPAGQGHRAVRELLPVEGGRAQGRLRRGRAAVPGRQRRPGHRREHLHRAGPHAGHPADPGRAAGRHHPRVGHADRRRPGLPGRRARAGPHRPLHGRRGVLHRHRRGDRPDRLGRRPRGRHRQARPGRQGDHRHLRRRHPRRARPLQGVERVRRRV
ncbi:MAG: Branched-chain amino acid aminotransferase, partial [uncultured Corynebacteriales bacterium]